MMPQPTYCTSHNIMPDQRVLLGEHALIGISTFNSYFSVENMEKLFFWAQQNFRCFDIFLMDGASRFNLMAMGYDELKAFRKTKKYDNNVKNKVIKSLININFSLIESENKILLLSKLSHTQKYIEMYKLYKYLFEENVDFRNDCLEATRTMLSSKMQNITDDTLSLAIKYLLAELPLWLNAPYILKIYSSIFVYKNLSLPWQKICYQYNLLSPHQKIMIKSVD